MTPHTRRIIRTGFVQQGRNSINPPSPQTSWQRERERGRVEPMDGQDSIGSLLPLAIAMLVIVGCFWLIAAGGL